MWYFELSGGTKSSTEKNVLLYNTDDFFTKIYSKLTYVGKYVLCTGSRMLNVVIGIAFGIINIGPKCGIFIGGLWTADVSRSESPKSEENYLKVYFI